MHVGAVFQQRLHGLAIAAHAGIAQWQASGDEQPATTLSKADQALYAAKRAGRNQVDLESSQLMLAADGTLKPVNA